MIKRARNTCNLRLLQPREKSFTTRLFGRNPLDEPWPAVKPVIGASGTACFEAVFNMQLCSLLNFCARVAVCEVKAKRFQRASAWGCCWADAPAAGSSRYHHWWYLPPAPTPDMPRPGTQEGGGGHKRSRPVPGLAVFWWLTFDDLCALSS